LREPQQLSSISQADADLFGELEGRTAGLSLQFRLRLGGLFAAAVPGGD
jgi:hypothetical protein